MRQSSVTAISSLSLTIVLRRRFWICGVMLISIAGCGSKTPTPQEFRRALQVYFDAHPVCLPVAFKFPAYVRASDASIRRRSMLWRRPDLPASKRRDGRKLGRSVGPHAAWTLCIMN
jgi:hypothetical protein